LFFQIEDITYRHPGLQQEAPPALKNISVTIAAGEWIALVGANGSGKTTLARHLNALLQPTSGRVFVSGLDTREARNLAAIRAQVGMVFQSPEDQIVASLVSEDTAFGPENLAVPSIEVQERIRTALGSVGMWEQRERPPHLLSAGQIQRVALAGVLAMQPRCILFDETTAMLDPIGKRDVLRQMQRLHEQGMTILMITHSMDEAALAERVLLLDHGRLVFDGRTEELFKNEALLQRCHLELPFGYRLRQFYQNYFPQLNVDSVDREVLLRSVPDCPAGLQQLPTAESDALLHLNKLIEVSDLRHTYSPGTPLAQLSLDGVSMSTHEGTIHGLVGATGSGKSTLLQHFNGIYIPQSGKVRVGQFDTSDEKTDLRALRRYAGMVFQNPELYFFEQYVGDEIAYAAKLYFGRERLRERVQQAMMTVGLDFDSFKDRFPNTLSGGEKRKVALASALVADPELLILDEPTAGLDPQSRQGLLKTLQQLQKEGHSIVLSSHNMEDIAELAQEMTILQQGKSVATAAVGELFGASSMLQEAYLLAPGGAVLAAQFRAKGWPIPLEVVTLTGLKACLAQLLGSQPG
jgi:energy-coupling factor transport system ATP-binding protein